MYKVTFSAEDTSFLPLYITGFLGGSDGKESACNAGDPGLIPGRLTAMFLNEGDSGSQKSNFPSTTSCQNWFPL